MILLSASVEKARPLLSLASMFPALLLLTPLSIIYHILNLPLYIYRFLFQTCSKPELTSEKQPLLQTTKQNSTSEKPTTGPHGAYHSPLLPASDLMKKIISDQISMALGPAAILLQIAHPNVGRGVEAHTFFVDRPISRGRRSVVYIFTQALGTEEERRYITDSTHRSHARIHKAGGLGMGEGEAGYNANDPEAQMWVAATMYWSLLTGYEDCYGRFDSSTQERLLAEFSVFATALRVPPGMWPKSRKEFSSYWDSMLANLVVTPAVQGVANAVLYPKNLPFWYAVYMGINGPLSRVVTKEKLPREVASMYGLESTPWTRAVYAVALQVTRAWWPWQMPAIRTAMSDTFMRDMRRRRAEGVKW